MASNKNGENMHGGSSEQHAKAGEKGGEAVSQDRQHMAEIGRKGGEKSQGGGSSQGGGGNTRGGSREQHAKAGRQSHKND